MISETVSYTNYDDEKKVRKLWFHMTKQDIIDNLDLKSDFEALQRIFTTEKRGLSELEVKQILDLVKRVVKLSYGERSDDGERFKKASANPEVWDAFFESAVYDEFMTNLFTPDPSKSFEFMLSVMPKDLMRQVEAEQPEAYRQYQEALGTDRTPEQLIADIQDARAAGARPFDPTKTEADKPERPKRPQDMTREELLAAMQAKNANLVETA